MMVAVVPQRQADRQTLSGCILPERKPKAVKLLLCEREERQLELQGVNIGVTRQPGVENGLL